MRTAVKYFLGLGAFALGAGTFYWFLTFERIGSILFWSVGLTLFVIAAWLIRRRALHAPVEGDDAEASADARPGEIVGSFPTRSVWPLFLVLGVVVTGAGLVYGLLLVPVGIAIGVVAVLGLMRESEG